MFQVVRASAAFAAVIILTFAFSSEVFAQAAKIKARRAIVSVDGAALYAKPDFDSEVRTYLNVGEQVISSVKTYNGKGGIGLFFALKTKSGVKGFIADTDLIDASTKKPLSPLMKGQGPVDLSEGAAADAGRSEKDFGSDGYGEEEPLYFKRYLGVAVGQKGYSKKYAGTTYHSDMTFFGLKGMGPGTLFDGPPFDFNLLVSFDSPKFYKEYAQNEPNGFIVYSDLLLQLPLWEAKNHLVHYGFGVMWSYSKYRVQLANSFKDESEFRWGGELGFGYGYRIFQKYIVKLDYKYSIEKHQNNGYWLSFMTEY